jgi:hypothetical protein
VTDIDDSVFTYAFDTTDPNFKKVDSLFTIDLNTGSISVKDGIVFDYETMGADTAMTVKIVVSDKSVTTGKAADIKSSFATATIKILDANESPLLVDQQFAVDEHMPRGTVVDTVVFDDLDKDPIKRIDVFTAVGGDTAYFSIDQNGVIRTKKEFDYETERRTYTIDVALTDKNDPTLTVVRTMTIDIRNVNENPVITTETISVKENPEDGTIVDTLEALDKDIGDTNLVFTLLEDPSGCFDVTEGGVVTVKKCKDLDYEKTKNILITVKVEDPHGGSSTRVVYVNVIDVPSPSVEITQAENSDSTWKFPDSIWTKQDVIDVCSTESVNALGIVANDTKPMMVLHELQHNSLLSIIGILVFIDENKLEPFCIFASDVVIIAEKYVGVHQQIVEVHGIGLTQPLVVSFIDCPDCRHLAVAVTFLIGLYQFVIRSCFKVVFCHRNPVVDCCWLVYLVVKAEVLYYLFQQRARVSLVIYRELRVVTYA